MVVLLRYLLLVALVAAAVMSELADGAKGKGKGKGRRRKKGVRRRLILNDENWSTKAIPESGMQQTDSLLRSWFFSNLPVSNLAKK